VIKPPGRMVILLLKPVHPMEKEGEIRIT